uniref:Uncharacterized protein n=1 Tax=Nothobranchius rachovii TaxID=451742 RepID=A0A1A8RV00_9TELE
MLVWTAADVQSDNGTTAPVIMTTMTSRQGLAERRQRSSRRRAGLRGTASWTKARRWRCEERADARALEGGDGREVLDGFRRHTGALPRTDSGCISGWRKRKLWRRLSGEKRILFNFCQSRRDERTPNHPNLAPCNRGLMTQTCDQEPKRQYKQLEMLSNINLRQDMKKL